MIQSPEANMTVIIQPETEDALRALLLGTSTPQEFEAWLVSEIDELSGIEQAELWRLRLMLVEHGEGFRSLEDVRQQAATILAEHGSKLKPDTPGRGHPPRLGRRPR
jgi:hypothetical protein